MSKLPSELLVPLCDPDLHLLGEGTLEVVDYFESLDSGWAGESAPALISFAGWLGFQSLCSLALRFIHVYMYENKYISHRRRQIVSTVSGMV
jgi:hypothetical protein